MTQSLASRLDRASLYKRDVNRHTYPPTSFECYEPIDERTTIVNVLSVDSDLGVLDASHQSAGFRQVDRETSESHEKYFARNFQDSSEEGVRVSGLPSWSAMEKAGCECSLESAHVPPFNCSGDLGRRSQHAVGFIHRARTVTRAARGTVWRSSASRSE